jgi:FKBP-type peptidyl-prolyl cis-trans isomerase FkpA
MINKTAYFSLLGLFLFLAFSCNKPKKNPYENMSQKEINEKQIEENKQFVNLEKLRIDKYIERNALKMITTGTGLRYKIYFEGNGEKAEEGKVALVNYKISLLDGTLVYQSEDKPEDFLIGTDNVESGIHEGITYMKVGDKALFIVPSHLAHGLTGDSNKIPSRSTLIFDIELVGLNS